MLSPKSAKRSKQKPSSSAIVIEAEITKSKPHISVRETVPIKQIPDKTKPGVEKVKQKRERMENAYDVITVANKSKSKSSRSKSDEKQTSAKKVISLRDLPVDEIYIPLTGPEVDFEDIIRKTSPNVKKKSSEKTSSNDEIIIPLTSPPTFDKSISKSHAKKGSSSSSSNKKSPETGFKEESRSREGYKKKEMKYEVCKDGSIYIPLRSPDDDDDDDKKKNKVFENDVINVEDDKQIKGINLNLSSVEPEVKKEETRLSNTLPSGSKSGKYYNN